MNIKYCIQCERDVMLDTLECHSVAETDGDEFGCETFIYTCYGPFASIQPPVNFEEDGDLQMVEPDGDEMFLINRNAEILLYDFLG